MTGTSRWVCRCVRAAAVAVLQAMTIVLTPRPISHAAMSSARCAQLGVGPVAVREPRGVAEVDEVLSRQLGQALVEHRQTPDAGVEHPDRVFWRQRHPSSRRHRQLGRAT